MKAHDDDITQLQVLDSKQVLVSVSKDKTMKMWSFPQEWVDSRLLTCENIEDSPKTVAIISSQMTSYEASLGGSAFDPQKIE